MQTEAGWSVPPPSMSSVWLVEEQLGTRRKTAPRRTVVMHYHGDGAAASSGREHVHRHHQKFSSSGGFEWLRDSGGNIGTNGPTLTILINMHLINYAIPKKKLKMHFLTLKKPDCL